MRANTRRLGFVASALLLAGCASAAPGNSDPEVDADGLSDVRSRALDTARVRPGTDFSQYTGLIVRAPELVFSPAERDKKQIELDSDQKQKFAAALAAAFDAELVDLANLKRVTESAADVLELSVRVQDITASVPGRSAGGPGFAGFALQAGGSVSIVMELKDASTQELLARGVDKQTVEGAAVRQKDGHMLTRWIDIDKLCADWAMAARKGIDALTAER